MLGGGSFIGEKEALEATVDGGAFLLCLRQAEDMRCIATALEGTVAVTRKSPVGRTPAICPRMGSM